MTCMNLKAFVLNDPRQTQKDTDFMVSHLLWTHTAGTGAEGGRVLRVWEVGNGKSVAVIWDECQSLTHTIMFDFKYKCKVNPLDFLVGPP